MPVDTELLSILACPSEDHAPLREVTQTLETAQTLEIAQTLECTYCLSRFPVRDGIPVLLIDEATPGPHGIGVAADVSAPDS